MKHPSKLSGYILLFLLLTISGCATNVEKHVAPAVDNPKPKKEVKTDTPETTYIGKGKASFYANKFQNRKTANGERFKQSALTAAHKKLPFGTKVKVTNTKNGKSVIVRINDRGPYVRGRVIDLSRSAFKKIGNTRAGVIKVKLEIVKPTTD